MAVRVRVVVAVDAHLAWSTRVWLWLCMCTACAHRMRSAYAQRWKRGCPAWALHAEAVEAVEVVGTLHAEAGEAVEAVEAVGARLVEASDGLEDPDVMPLPRALSRRARKVVVPEAPGH